MQSARACPFIGETFQFVNNIVFVGRNVIGCGELYAEHGLVCIESYLFGMAQGALQDAGFVSYMDFLPVDDEAWEDNLIGFRGEVQLHFVERNHTLYTTQENLTVTGYAERVLIDGCQREAVLGAVIVKIFIPVIKDGKTFVCDEQQFTAGGRFLRFIDTVAGQAVFPFVEILEVIGFRTV